MTRGMLALTDDDDKNVDPSPVPVPPANKTKNRQLHVANGIKAGPSGLTGCAETSRDGVAAVTCGVDMMRRYRFQCAGVNMHTTAACISTTPLHSTPLHTTRLLQAQRFQRIGGRSTQAKDDRVSGRQLCRSCDDDDSHPQPPPPPDGT